MQVVSSLDVAAQKREITLPLGGGKATKTLFLGPWEKPRTPEPGVSPQAYTVRQEHQNITHAHYHQTEQWQVIVEGTGKLGRANVAPVALAASASGSEDTSLSGSVSATDADGNTLTYSLRVERVSGGISPAKQIAGEAGGVDLQQLRRRHEPGPGVGGEEHRLVREALLET